MVIVKGFVFGGFAVPHKGMARCAAFLINEMKEMMRHLHAKGFSLFELMTVLAIVAILIGIAYPSYTESVRKSNRGDAQAALTGLASVMQRHYSENTPSTFEGAAAGGGDTGAPGMFPSQSPLDSAIKHYNLQIASANGTSYTLRAVPISGSAQGGDKCGTLTLTSVGQRGITSGESGVVWQDCWR